MRTHADIGLTTTLLKTCLQLRDNLRVFTCVNTRLITDACLMYALVVIQISSLFSINSLIYTANSIKVLNSKVKAQNSKT